MPFGLTRGEAGLALFIFVLVYGAGLLPRLGDKIADWMGAPPRDKEPPA